MTSRLFTLFAICPCACSSSRPEASPQMTAPVASRIWMCPDYGMREFVCDRQELRPAECTNNQSSYKFLGNIDAASTGTSVNDREVLQVFAERAQRIKADAIIDVRWEQRPGSYVRRLTGRAISFSRPGCKTPG